MAAKPQKPKSKPALSSCDCKDCRAACLNSPGWFLPGQIAPLAERLKLSVEDLFGRYLAVGVTRMPDGTERHGVMPHKLRDRKKAGSVWTLDELAEPGRCVFYDRGKCSIYEHRPDECARMSHDRGDAVLAIRHAIVRRWDDAALEPYRKLTGRRLNGPKPRRRRSS